MSGIYKEDNMGLFYVKDEFLEEDVVEECCVDSDEWDDLQTQANGSKGTENDSSVNCEATNKALDNGFLCMHCNVKFDSMDEYNKVHNECQADGRNNESDAILDVEEQQWEALEEVADNVDISSKSYTQHIKYETHEESNYYEQYEEEADKKSWLEVDNVEAVDECSVEEEIVKEEQLDEEDNGEQRYFCCECQTVFADLESAEQHDCPAFNDLSDAETVGMPKAQFLCQQCGMSFSNLVALRNHSRVHKAKSKTKVSKVKAGVVTKSVACEICNTIFSSMRGLKLHMKIHGERPHKTIQEALPAGAKVQYNDLNQFYCEICNKSFDESLLIVHKNMHQQMEEHTCSICNRQFNNLSSYEMHLKMHQDNGSVNGIRPQLKRPLETGKRSFPCQYCGHEFQRPNEKVKHERVHTGEKPYKCEVCGKTFRVSYSLTLHLRTHTDIRPYVCATCNKRFKSHAVYTHHLKTHLNERSYKCEICDKAFRTSVQLCGHRNSHTKPFNCPECNRPFSTLYSVKIHMKTHNKGDGQSEGLTYRCDFCGAVYARSFALQMHIKEQHENGDFEPITVSADGSEQSNRENLVLVDAEMDCEAYVSTVDSEERIVDEFHTEEIITDWLTK